MKRRPKAGQQMRIRLRMQACSLCRHPDHNRRTCMKRAQRQMFFEFA